MYRITNISGQRMPTKITSDGEILRVSLITYEQVESEEIHPEVKRQESQGYMKIEEIEDEVEEVIEEVDEEEIIEEE